MKSQLLSVRTVHHIEESQLDQMLILHSERLQDHVSFLVSPPCFSTNFMSMTNFELTSTEDEAQGSTSRTVAGEKVTCGTVEGHGDSQRGGMNRTAAPVTETEHAHGGGDEYASENQASPAGNSISRESGNDAELIRGWQLTAPLNEDANQQQLHNGTGAVPIKRIGPSISDFSILHRPHIVRKKEEVHVELCHKCERMASGHCECGLAVCSAHRYSSDGERNPYGMCGKCQKEITSDVEIFSNGRQV